MRMLKYIPSDNSKTLKIPADKRDVESLNSIYHALVKRENKNKYMKAKKMMKCSMPFN